MPSNLVLYHGSEEPITPAVPLRAGDLTMIFEPDLAVLRYIRLGDHEVVRAIYGAVRDSQWRTVPARVSNLLIQAGEKSFEITFDVDCSADGIHFPWHGRICGSELGQIVFEFSGEARSSFARNRIGLCLLHSSLECAGKPCVVEHVDGSVEEGVFPKFISPHQAFKNIRAITHEVAPGARAEVRLTGEVFEMEDQRNWTDASFKTYSTPLELPIPVEVRAGTRVEQSVTVTLVEPKRKILPILQGRPPQISISTTGVVGKPPLGLALAGQGHRLTPREVNRLRSLRLAHLRVDLDLTGAHWKNVLALAIAEAAALELPLHLALHATLESGPELDAVRDQIGASDCRIALWIVLEAGQSVTGGEVLNLARETLSPIAPGALFAAGTMDNFVELNRNRSAPGVAALPLYPIQPQVHARDLRTLAENLGAQGITLETAQQFCPRAAVVSPITLRGHDVRAGRAEDEPGAFSALPDSVDPRQTSLFGAGWTLGSIARLGITGSLHSLTYYETTGWRGVMERESGSPLPEMFHSIPGAVFPLYHVFADLADLQRLLPAHSTHPLQVEALCGTDGTNRRRVLLANLTAEPQEVKIKSGTSRATVRMIDETNAERAMTDPEMFRETKGQTIESAGGKIEVSLRPFAYARLDFL